MSNFRAVAAVTQTLVKMLEPPVGDAVPGAGVTILRPDDAVGLAKAGLNIYLYQVTPNASWRNEDLPTRPESGKGVFRRPRAAVDLHYLFTFHGSETAFEPQLILGKVVATLHARPVLDRTTVQNAINQFSDAELKKADLANDVDLVRVTPLPLSLEELTKIWSVFLQPKYALSVAYQASVVLLEGEEVAQPPVPVASHRVVVVPSTGPVLERLRSKASAPPDAPERDGLPMVLTDKLIIEGRSLRGQSTTRVRIGHALITPAAADIDDNRIVIDLATMLPADERRAGVKLVQVVQDIAFDTPDDPHRGFESNALPFMLAPVITVTSTTAATVELSVSPPVAVGQRAVLLLSKGAAAFAFPMIVKTAGSTLTVPIAGVPPDDYLARLQLDGAESPIDVDANGLFKDTPKASIPA